jgi:hypothetical protein
MPPLDLHANIDVSDMRLTQRFAQGVPDLAVRSQVDLSGPRGEPHVGVAIETALHSDTYDIPAINSRLDLNGGALSLT